MTDSARSQPAGTTRAANPSGAADVLKEACGVFGIYGPGLPVAHFTYLGLYALQHRGQESAGMAVGGDDGLMVTREMGLVSTVFTERTLAGLQGDRAIGHTRYSTTGSSTWRNAQPVFRGGAAGSDFALGHNGNLVNTAELAAEAGMFPGTVASDSDLVAELLAAEMVAGADPDSTPVEVASEAIMTGRRSVSVADGLERALVKVLPRLRGAYSFVLIDDERGRWRT